MRPHWPRVYRCHEPGECGSSPVPPILAGLVERIWLSSAGQGVPRCPDCSCDARPGAHLGGNTLTAAELADLDGHDPGLGLVVVVNASHSGTSRAVAQKADDFDDLAYLGKIHAGVLVELVNRVRVLHREPDVVVTRHTSTMARSHRLPRSREPDAVAELHPQAARELGYPLGLSF